MDIDDILKEFEESSKDEKISSKTSSINLYQDLLRAMINERMARNYCHTNKI